MLEAATILVVDDQPYVRRTLRSLLAVQSHWKVHEAENGKVALDRIRKLKPHVVVMDIVMPEMGGIEAAYEIHQRALGTKVILISSHYTPEEAVTLRRMFADGAFLQKSEAGRELIPAISRLLPTECQARIAKENAPGGETLMADEARYVVKAVECPHCKATQKVHLSARPGSAQLGSQYISCVECDTEFDVRIADKIVGGPFPA